MPVPSHMPESELLALTGGFLVMMCRDEAVRHGITYKAIAQAAMSDDVRVSSTDWSRKIGDYVCDQVFDKLGPVILGAFFQNELGSLGRTERTLKSTDIIRHGLLHFFASRDIASLKRAKQLADHGKLDRLLQCREVGGSDEYSFDKLMRVQSNETSPYFAESLLTRKMRSSHWITVVALTASERLDEIEALEWRSRERELLPPKDNSRFRAMLRKLYGESMRPGGRAEEW